MDNTAETQEKTPLVGLVLIGGRSLRMGGRDKARIPYGETPQFQRAMDLLRPHCESVFLSLRPDQAQYETYGGQPHIVDEVTEIGPLGGVYSAMKAYPDKAFLVLACDLPMIDDAAISQLVTSRNAQKLATAFVIPHANFPEPLCTIYEARALLNLNALIVTGKHSLRRFLLRADIQRLEPPQAWSLMNANTPEDVRKAEALLHDRSAAVEG
jgi:molybdopterin-guanine dinucleotide biosynthesis protein A